METDTKGVLNMIDNENNLTENTTEQDNNIIPAQTAQFPDYQPVVQANEIQSTNSVNEVAYYPPVNNAPPKKKKRILLKSILALICVAVISIGSIAGYITLSDNGYKIPFLNSDKDDGDDDIDDDDDDIISDDNVANKDLPTLIQMAGKEDALSVPEIVKKVSPSVVGISSVLQTGTSTGTGIIMSEDGYIITNGHVVEDATQITVMIAENDQYVEEKASLVGIDTKTDLAVLKINKKNLTPAEFGKSSELQVGELAIAIGNPLGFELAGSVTGGIISALNRELNIENKNLTLIQTDAAINPGNSGGPLVNCYGQVIGINSAKISSAYAEGLGFAIPMDEAKPIIDNLIQYGYVKGRPMIGISGQDISAAQAKFNDVPQGVYVVFTSEGSGAEKAGIKNGDIITAVDGKSITSMSDITKHIEDKKAGEKIELTVFRDNKTFDVTVVLTEAKQ